MNPQASEINLKVYFRNLGWNVGGLYDSPTGFPFVKVIPLRPLQNEGFRGRVELWRVELLIGYDYSEDIDNDAMADAMRLSKHIYDNSQYNLRDSENMEIVEDIKTLEGRDVVRFAFELERISGS